MSVSPARTFGWSLRRELWENPALFGAPLAAAAAVFLPYLFVGAHLPHQLAVLAHPANAKAAAAARMQVETPYDAAAFFVLTAAFVTALFYSLAALHNERRDRSVLFWKSLPVSDTVTVLAKALTAIVIPPLIAVVVIVAANALMLGWGTLVLLVRGLDPHALWSHTPLPFMWLVLALGLPYVALWLAPTYAWCMLVSAWARRTPFLWALGPPFALAAIEFVSFRTHRVFDFVVERVAGGFGEAFSVGGLGKTPVRRLADLDPGRLFSEPALWLGLAAAAVFIFVAIRVRRAASPF